VGTFELAKKEDLEKHLVAGHTTRKQVLLSINVRQSGKQVARNTTRQAELEAC
jgi:hypothetical protein